MLPSLFIAHGAPLLAIEDNSYTRILGELAKKYPTPKAIVIFTAHWESDVQKISDVDEYDMIYDFGGFPDELYQIVYPAKGEREVAKQIGELLRQGNIPFVMDEFRGIDHGAWVVLRLVYPQADVPVIQMSVNPRLTSQEHYQIGQALEGLREQDVLIIGSGGTSHNLRRVNWGKDDADEWALQFEQWLEAHITKWDMSGLFEYETNAPYAADAVPKYGNEHFVPLLYAMGAADKEKKAELIERSFRYGNLSHVVWQFGSVK